MPEIFVAKYGEMKDGDQRIVKHGALEIGVFRWDGRFYGYRNLCVHQGGPACEGIMMHKVEEVLSDDRRLLGQRFSETEMHFVCPWHGFEYDLRTGECVTDRSLKLRSFPITIQGDDIYVVAD